MIKGYKDGKETYNRTVGYINNYDEFKKLITDPLHVLDNDPTFLGRTVDSKDLIGVSNSPFTKPWIIELDKWF